MQRKNYALLLPLLIVLAVLFASAELNAQCLEDNPACGIFSTNTIEFLGTQPATCNLPAGSATFVPCTAYFYKYSGSSTNQVNVAIPKTVMTRYTASDATIAGCSQLYTDGSGDPTTAFGKYLLTHNICRVAVTFTSFPGVPGANFRLTADPSTPAPDAWQLRQSSHEVYADLLLAPGVPAAPVAETGATLTTPEGATVSYTIVNGQITVTGGTAVPISDTKLCVFNGGNDRTFPSNWTCETIAFATDQCDIKTTGADPCRFIGGTCILY